MYITEEADHASGLLNEMEGICSGYGNKLLLESMQRTCEARQREGIAPTNLVAR